MQKYDFAINAIANIFVHERLNIPELYSEPSQTSNMELFAEIVNCCERFLNIFANSSILDVRLFSKYVSNYSYLGAFDILLGK